MNMFKIIPIEIDIRQSEITINIPQGAEFVEFTAYPPPVGRMFVWFKVATTLELSDFEGREVETWVEEERTREFKIRVLIGDVPYKELRERSLLYGYREQYLGSVAVMERSRLEGTPSVMKPVFLWGRKSF